MPLKIHVTMSLALLYTSAAIRGRKFGRNPEDIKNLVSESVTICGNDDIWDDITSPKTVRGIKGIDWKGIDDAMQDYVGDHKDLVASSDKVINNLKSHLSPKN